MDPTPTSRPVEPWQSQVDGQWVRVAMTARQRSHRIACLRCTSALVHGRRALRPRDTQKRSFRAQVFVPLCTDTIRREMAESPKDDVPKQSPYMWSIPPPSTETQRSVLYLR